MLHLHLKTCSYFQVVSYGSDADIARNKEKLVDQLDKMAKSKPPSDLIRLSMEFQPATNNQEGFHDMFGEMSKTRDREAMVKVKTENSQICKTAR